MKKLFTIAIIGFVMMCSTLTSLHAQVYNKLPDDFEKKYSSSDAYHKAQEEALIAEQKAAEEEAFLERLNRLVEAFYDNDWTKYFNDKKALVKRMNENYYYDIKSWIYYVLYSSEPFEVGYILECCYVESKDSDSLLLEHIFVYSLDVESKKCTLLKCCDENDKLVQNILKHNERIEEF